MKFKKINQNVLFHHFHSKNKFYYSPGSLTKDNLYKFIKENKNKIKNSNNLEKKNDNKYFLTFDDGLKSQYEIALPILEENKIKSFFFFFTSHFNGHDFTIENIRYFKYKYYLNTKLFFNHFMKTFEEKHNKKINFGKANLKKIFKFYKKHSPYYPKEEIYIKILRDNILSELQYSKIIKKMMKDKNLNISQLSKKLYMNKSELKNLSKLNHTIGLHSHSHNHKNKNFSYDQEFNEFKKNKLILEKIINKKIITASYPFGNFTNNSERILKKLGVKYSFLKNEKFKNTYKNNNLFLPRKNISELLLK